MGVAPCRSQEPLGTPGSVGRMSRTQPRQVFEYLAISRGVAGTIVPGIFQGGCPAQPGQPFLLERFNAIVTALEIVACLVVVYRYIDEQ